MSDLRGGKGVLMRALMSKMDYTEKKAKQVVDAFILILRDQLTEGKTIKIPGLGRLTPWKSGIPTHRKIEKNFRNCPTTIITVFKYPISIRLRKPTDMS
jgi:nucleoid DNA-binding protein